MARCHTCKGRGSILCYHCDGSGDPCHEDYGITKKGRKNLPDTCSYCGGCGRIECPDCGGTGCLNDEDDNENY